MKLVKQKESDKTLFIQHTARTYPGQSGGPLLIYSGKWYLAGIVFKCTRITLNQGDRMSSKLLTRLATAVSVDQFR